jgi:hypothetical protein
MTKAEKYLEALKTFDDWVIVSEWAQRVGELYPNLLQEAEEQAARQTNPTTGLREIAARISSRLSTGGFPNVEVDESERPRKVRYITAKQKEKRKEEELESDIEPLTRAERIRQELTQLDEFERYRIEEFESIAKQLNKFFNLDFEVDHAVAILNPEQPGRHHPDNLQLLLKAHNSRKGKNNWKRFTFEEQREYIHQVVRLQSLIASKMGISMTDELLDSLMQRLEKIYQ